MTADSRPPRPWPKHLGPKRAFMRQKRKEAKELLRAMDAFWLGSMGLPPAADLNAGGHFHAIQCWIKGPCCKAWRES